MNKNIIALLAQTTRFLLVKHQIELLKKGGFRLRKWVSNATALLSELDPADHGLATHKVLQDDEYIKVLRILWNPKLDIFQFSVIVLSLSESNEPFCQPLLSFSIL